MTISAGRYSLELKELSWWEKEELKASMVSGAKITKGGDVTGVDGQALLDIKVKTFEKCIVSIKEGETSVSFSLEWMKSLTEEEGEAISDAIDNLGKKK